MPNDSAPGPEFVKWVAMTHDGVEGHATATEKAFNEVHARKGWTKVADLGWHRTAPTVSPQELAVSAGEAESSLTKDELRELARAQGLDDSGTKAEIAARLEAANPGGNS